LQKAALGMHGFKSILFTAGALFCLLVPDAQATLRHAPTPPGAFIIFDFPAYSSLHDCSFYQHDYQNKNTPLSSKACIQMLLEDKKLSETDDEFRKSEYFRNFIGEFGPNPLLYGKAKMLFCDGDCHELEAHRSGPPEMMWRPPDIENKKTHLVYPLRASVPRDHLRLSLAFADGDWRSNLFAALWYHNYMHVHLDKANHALIIKRDWLKTLQDTDNYMAIWNHMQVFVLFWLGLLLLAVIGLLIDKFVYRWQWRDSGRMFIVHAAGQILTITLFFTFAPDAANKALAIALILLIYTGGMLPEFYLFRHGIRLHRRRLSSREILRVQLLMRLPFALLLMALLVFA